MQIGRVVGNVVSTQKHGKLDGAKLLPMVRAGTKFVDGVLRERHDEEGRKEAA